jgi:hypothetical protein
MAEDEVKRMEGGQSGDGSRGHVTTCAAVTLTPKGGEDWRIITIPRQLQASSSARGSIPPRAQSAQASEDDNKLCIHKPKFPDKLGLMTVNSKCTQLYRHGLEKSQLYWAMLFTHCRSFSSVHFP